MKLGFIVTVYNKEKYLKMCLDSILSQTNGHFKLVVIDDGSTDNSGLICDLYAKKDSRIIVKHQENSGEIAAILEGVELLDTEYVAFVDADDWIDEYTVERVMPYIDKGIDLISFCIERFYDKQYQYVTKNNYSEGTYEGEQLDAIRSSMIWNCEESVFGIDPSLCNKVFNRRLFYEEMMKIKDIWLGFGKDVAISFSILSKIESLHILDDVLYYHRQREVGEKAGYISSNHYFEDLVIIYNYLLDIFNGNELYKKQLDYFFVNEAKRKIGVYSSERIKGRYRQMFPYKKIEKGSRVVLYGANEVGQEFFEQIQRTKYAEIVLWVDKRYEDYLEQGVKNPQELRDIYFEKVVVASDREEVILSIVKDLKEMEISDESIITICDD